MIDLQIVELHRIIIIIKTPHNKINIKDHANRNIHLMDKT